MLAYNIYWREDKEWKFDSQFEKKVMNFIKKLSYCSYLLRGLTLSNEYVMLLF